MVQQFGDGLHGAQQAQLLRLVEARQHLAELAQWFVDGAPMGCQVRLLAAAIGGGRHFADQSGAFKPGGVRCGVQRSWRGSRVGWLAAPWRAPLLSRLAEEICSAIAESTG